MSTPQGKTPRRINLADAARIIRDGGVLAYPTETFYALGAGLNHASAMARVSAIKNRPAAKPLPLILGDLDQLAKILHPDFAAGPHFADLSELMTVFWPGPLSLVLPAGPDVPSQAKDGRGLTSVRLPGHAVARELCLAADMPITATSANISGRQAARLACELAADLPVDAVLDLGEAPAGERASTVAVVRGNRELILLRPGAVSVDALEAAGFRVIAPGSTKI
ncbi:MAG: threonylcarbamoyl-AMP synthase [Desulfovibrionaceae bacterium]|nr:threonylcarbamoyl-AMP synthase [Desulfovibrionaceae bacterium]MBF0513525.1 threonylcarbamoyl-AMP synthase [Desulfovibrionaceae bacterium]